MKITAVSVQNFKRVRDVRITPDADRALVLIGGKNGHGKSSTLDALTAAFGGARALPADPVRHGAEEAEIIINLDGGLTIRRTIAPDGTSKLEVRNEMGAVKAPQSVLDRIISGRFLDPLAFLAMPAKEQRAQLMKQIKDSERIATLDEKRALAFAKRTEVGRDLSRAEGELARLPAVEVGTPIDVAALHHEVKTHEAERRERERLESVRAQCERETTNAKATLASTLAEKARIDAEIERLKGLSIQLGIKASDWAEDVAKCQLTEADATKMCDKAADRWDALQPRITEVDAELARADEHNRAVYARRAQMDRRAETAETVSKLTRERDDLTKVLETIDGRKAGILAAAQLPVEGLSIDDEGITLNGVPFIQASAAERLRVALGLAIAAAPDLGDVWVRDGALLDEESLELVASQAAAAGKRVWVERVGTRDPGVIVIQDGQVQS
jgi:DNA repair exonuclease SbcCD ATPase subunit